MVSDSQVADTPSKLLSPLELAAILGVPVTTIYAWRGRGYGPPAIRVGKHLRWRPEEVEAWLTRRASDVLGEVMADQKS